jgi:hypothetical protein
MFGYVMLIGLFGLIFIPPLVAGWVVRDVMGPARKPRMRLTAFALTVVLCLPVNYLLVGQVLTRGGMAAIWLMESCGAYSGLATAKGLWDSGEDLDPDSFANRFDDGSSMVDLCR